MTLTGRAPTGGVRVRVRPFRGRADLGELTSAPPGALVPPELLADAVGRAADAGFATLVTPAIPRHEWAPYLAAGFEIREELHLLVHPLLELPPMPDVALRRAVRRDREAVLAIDRQAFAPFWQLDDRGLDEALRATPATRFRTDKRSTPRAYAIVGRSGDRGYLQRLAVAPGHEGAGLGSALVVDGLRWLKRRRVREVYVNTQTGNERAILLYERLGFRRRPDGLAVLHLDLGHR